MNNIHFTFKAKNNTSSYKNGTIELPNGCPWCSSKISPNVIASNNYDYHLDEKGFNASLTLECPNCKKHFLQSYRIKFRPGYSEFTSFIINESPQPKSTFEYPEEIDSVSHEFKNIIAQSTVAEGLGLDHLAGIGYRKALEFLIKDYLINHKKLDEVKISKKLLGKCIEQDIDDERLKSLAKAATWIGNDETHYVRKHDSRDVNDMKKFLHKMTLFISYELAIDDALNFTSSESSSKRN
ncbi:DUF4145 domain-containing protein [Macrococcoides caseolyticum]|uniref:DUF4145 domain-containing protein n=1 Tax=Macrococcoides caseolyticum TaxID=69966 RepID=UPI001E5B38D1|nr:DUF4145 domain-containing protein [Macrococcus caseolyticus]